MAVKLLHRLSQQLAERGVASSDNVARSILIKRGHMDKNGKLTDKGKELEKLGASGRAKNRAAKYAKRNPEDYKYNKKSNLAVLK